MSDIYLKSVENETEGVKLNTNEDSRVKRSILSFMFTVIITELELYLLKEISSFVM